MSKFSILTACFNKEKFIKECVDSVLNQSCPDWELIIVDDCSTDKSYEYLKTLTDPRIKVIRNKERLYCSSTYALALQHATGKLCGILDGDDVLNRKAVRAMMKRYKKYKELDFIYSQFYWCDKRLGRPRQGFSNIPKKNKTLVDMALANKHCFSHWRTFRRSVAEKGEIFPQGLRVSVDKNMGFVLEELGRGAYLPSGLYFYRYYKDNMSRTLSQEQRETTLRLAKKRKKRRLRENIKVFPIICIE